MVLKKGAIGLTTYWISIAYYWEALISARLREILLLGITIM
jgi:hypothetical protein